jgi:hypothetical protein
VWSNDGLPTNHIVDFDVFRGGTEDFKSFRASNVNSPLFKGFKIHIR